MSEAGPDYRASEMRDSCVVTGEVVVRWDDPALLKQYLEGEKRLQAEIKDFVREHLGFWPEIEVPQ